MHDLLCYNLFIKQYKEIEMKNINPKNMGLKSYKTQINKSGNKTEIRYQGNLIATIDNQMITIDNCGWKSKTTKERLNVILDYYNIDFSIIQRDWKWYLINDKTKTGERFFGTAKFFEGKLLNM